MNAYIVGASEIKSYLRMFSSCLDVFLAIRLVCINLDSVLKKNRKSLSVIYFSGHFNLYRRALGPAALYKTAQSSTKVAKKHASSNLLDVTTYFLCICYCCKGFLNERECQVSMYMIYICSFYPSL